ncbi:MAG: YfcC family protein [Acidobacteriota bacterium]|nr:YfcC family protein [Acidobacteriota bacterium]
MFRHFRLPHPLALLTMGIIVAGVLTHVVPAGKYERREDAVTGREVVVAGTYQRVAPNALGPLDIALAVPRGIAEAADVLATVFLVGGAFVVVERTGALHIALAGLVRRLRRREGLAVPICCLAFAAGGALENMQEEIIALTPVVVLLAARLGFSPLTAVAMSLGAAAVGASFSPINPFQVGIAQQAAGVPLFSGSGFRMAVMAPALGLWIWGTARHARKTSLPAGPIHAEAGQDSAAAALGGSRTLAILLLVALGFAGFIFGLVRYGWSFNELSAIFLVVGILAGLIGRLGVNGTADAYVHGFRDMAFAALLIGFARGIFVVLNDGQIIDTIVHGLFTPLSGFPRAGAALGMMAVQAAVHVPVPSVSGQAVLTLPILAPLSDLLGFSRQVAVLAYQYGAGLCELLTPTNGALMAVLASAGVRYEDWMKFAVGMWAALMGIAALAILAALALAIQ